MRRVFEGVCVTACAEVVCRVFTLIREGERERSVRVPTWRRGNALQGYVCLLPPETRVSLWSSHRWAGCSSQE